jgi:hypothetical protein
VATASPGRRNVAATLDYKRVFAERRGLELNRSIRDSEGQVSRARQRGPRRRETTILTNRRKPVAKIAPL